MTDRTDTDTLTPDAVIVALHRPDGYEDVHPDLLIEDAHIHPDFRPEDVTATVRRLLAERDERIARLTALLREAHDALHIIDNRCEPSDSDRHTAEALQEQIRTALENTNGR